MRSSKRAVLGEGAVELSQAQVESIRTGSVVRQRARCIATSHSGLEESKSASDATISTIVTPAKDGPSHALAHATRTSQLVSDGTSWFTDLSTFASCADSMDCCVTSGFEVGEHHD